MPSRSNKRSVAVTVALTSLLLAGLLLLFPFIPAVVTSMLTVPDNIGNRGELSAAARIYVLTAAYAMYAIAIATLILFLVLMHKVSRGLVFSPAVSTLLFVLSLFCFAEALLFASIGFCFQLAYGVALAACILGVSLRVTRNVLDEAARIKAENDFTI